MANGKKQAVAVAEPAALPAVPAAGGANVPDYVRSMGPATSGLAGLDQKDFVIPRAILLQKLSKQPEAFETAKPKKFWMTVVDLPLGDSLDFIVCSNRKRYLLLPPMGDSRGILARADDGKTWTPDKGEWQVKFDGIKDPVTWRITHPDVRRSGLAEFGSSIPGNPDSKPAATLFYDYLVYLPDFPELSPCLISMARSMAKKARDLNGKIELRKAEMQTQRFRITPIDDKNPAGKEFYNIAVAYNGWATEAEYKLCKGIGERLGNYKVADEEAQAREEQANDAPAERGNL